MTIKRYNPKNPLEKAIKPGQYVCFEPLVTDYVCGHPRRVTKVSGERVYFRDRRDEYDEGYKNRSTVRFVCDTKEEGDALVAMNEPRFTAKIAFEKEFKEAWRAKEDELIAQSQQKDVDA